MECKICFGEGKMEESIEFKYLKIILWKNGGRGEGER